MEGYFGTSYSEEGSLAHYGVKGMKWGVRRYQKKDGTLTSAGKKKYRDAKGLLTEAGRKQRAENDKRVSQQSTKIRRKIENNSSYKQASANLQESMKKNRESYSKYRSDFLAGKDFKNLDYDQFKDAAYDRWSRTSEGKTEAKRMSEMRSVIEREVRNAIGDKAFNQPVPELMSGRSKNLGEAYCNRIFDYEMYMRTR